MATNELHLAYLRRLEPWPMAMRRYLYRVPGKHGLACFGPGTHGHWALQANATAASAFAVLASDPATDPAAAGMSRDELLDWALRLIRFTLTSHHAGGGATTDLQPWGHSWISALCLERMMHGIEALGAQLPAADRDLLGRVLVSESDWLLDHYTVVAGLVENNKPESNIWNGCILHRTARLVPDAPRRTEYIEKGTRFLLNGLSTPADATCRDPIAGRPLAEWHVGANLFDNMACNHHGYLNVGYMVICLSNIAMLHFSSRANGWTPPEGLYHHARELWQLVKTCTFPDGRLWRVGGDTRVRYCYCQDYAIPAWLLARDQFGDANVEAFERGWLKTLAVEAAANADGSFLSARLAPLEAVSPLYYVRLEGDRAASLSMGACWHRLLAQQPAAAAGQAAKCTAISILSDWSDAYHGAALVRGSRRLASWTWRAAEPPQGLCLPPAASSMAEWRGNLGGRVLGLGMLNDCRCQPGQTTSFAGGFATCGQVVVHTEQHAAEGETPEDVAWIELACAALPDDRTVIALQRARVRGRTWLREVKGLFLQIPNDIFNGMCRTYQHAGGQLVCAGRPDRAETRPIPGDWVGIDEQLSVVRVFGAALCLYRPAERQITIRPSRYQPHTEQAGGHLYADAICCGCRTGIQAHNAGSALFDLGVVLLAGVDATETATFVRATPPAACTGLPPALRGVQVTGADGRDYRVIANFGAEEATAHVGWTAGRAPRVLTGAARYSVEPDGLRIAIPPQQTAVLAG